jgi:hypothetical protein
VNSDLIFQSVKALNQEKVETTALLIDYFKRSGFNPFKAAEEAEKRNNSFIDFLNDEVTRCSQTGELCLFQPSSNRNVTCFNLKFFFVKQLLHELYNGITDTEFEIVCAKVLKNSWSVENANVTKAKSDGGYDFYGSYFLKGGKDNFSHSVIEIFGQSKQYGGNISRPEIEKFLGFIQKNNVERKHKPTIYIFATTSDFSSEAIQLANAFGIICWTGMQIASYIFNSLSFETTDANETLKYYLNN